MSDSSLSQIRIVLVEPAGAINIGSIARVMKNMGLSQLVLVDPRCDPFSEDAQNMAVHGLDVLQAAQIVDTIPEALVGCHRAIATTFRATLPGTVSELPRTTLPWLLEPNVKSAILFGSEYRGLSNEELKYAQRFVCIPSSDVYPSLNLAQAVAICCYELYLSHQDPHPSVDAPLEHPAPLDALEGYYRHLESLLLKVGYLFPHTAASRMEKIRRLFNRAYPSTTEVSMLRGMLRQIEWALGSRKKNLEKDGDL
jgi:tRNA/rRNA methyltransferase